MENTLVRVIAKYIDENGKAKSFHEFTIRIDSDIICYADSEVIAKTFQKLIDFETKDDCGKFIYYKHEPIFHEPTELKGDFDSAYEEAYYECYPSEKNEVSEYDACKEEVKESLLHPVFTDIINSFTK